MIPVWVLIPAAALAWLAVARLRRNGGLQGWHVLAAVFGTAVTIYILAGHPHGLS